VRSIAEVRSYPGPLIGFSEATRELNYSLKTFLREHVYKHYKVRRMTAKARRVVRELFDAFFNDAAFDAGRARSGGFAAGIGAGPGGTRARGGGLHCGMTDRYAILEHRRLFDPGERT